MGTDSRIRQRRFATSLLAGLLLLVAGRAVAGHISVTVDGVDGPLRDAVLAGLELNQYGTRDVTAAQANRLYERAADQVRNALEPYGYFHAEVSGELKENGADFVAVLHVTPGDPVRVATIDIRLDGDADGQAPVQKAIAAFVPAKGQPLDQGAYEKSKAAVQAALFGSGYLEAELVEKRVDVTRSANTADVHLSWKVGPRFRLGETEFEGGQFPDTFMQRYVPWKEGDFYTQDKVLELQQRLIDADYFAIAQVQPDIEKAHDGIVPIKVILGPAKRTIYTGGLFIGTDTGTAEAFLGTVRLVRDLLAEVLEEKVRERQFDAEVATRAVKAILLDNPLEFYGISPKAAPGGSDLAPSPGTPGEGRGGGTLGF